MILVSSSISEKKLTTKVFLFNRSSRQIHNKYLSFWVYCYCSSNKTDVVKLFKNIFAFNGMNFQNYFEKFEFWLSFCRISGIFTFSSKQEYPFNDDFVRAHQFWLRYQILLFSSTCVNIKPDSEQISAESTLFSARNPMFQSYGSQRWTALIQSWFSLKKRWIFQFWTPLMLSIFSESELKNVKSLKQRCPALIISGTSTREY